MKILMVEPDKPAVEIEIDEKLESLQKAVGGYIEAVYPFEDPVAIICNEEGKCNGMRLNRALYDEKGDVYDIIAGTFLVTGLTKDSFGSLSDELIETYRERFKSPEMFVCVNGKIIALKQTLQKRRSSETEK